MSEPIRENKLTSNSWEALDHSCHISLRNCGQILALKKKECASGSPLFLKCAGGEWVDRPSPWVFTGKEKATTRKKVNNKVVLYSAVRREGTLVMGVSTSMPSEQKPDWLYIVDVGSSIPFQEVESCSYTPYILGVRQTARDVHKKNIGVWVPKYSV